MPKQYKVTGPVRHNGVRYCPDTDHDIIELTDDEAQSLNHLIGPAIEAANPTKKPAAKTATKQKDKTPAKAAAKTAAPKTPEPKDNQTGGA